MQTILLRFITSLVVLALCSLLAYSQVSSTAPLSGVVTDPTGAVVPGAAITIKNNDTSAEFRATTAGNGTFTVPALNAGTYTVTISAVGFKQALVKDVKLDAGVPGNIRVGLEVGATTDTIVVQGGAEIVQSQSATISTTLVGRQLTDLPMATRNTLDLLVTLPGTTTTGSPRNSTFNGLGRNTINITIDGLNTQDNFLKSTDGFFSYISPRVDAIEEVSVSTATPGAESSGQGAVQIKMITRQGNNDLHGSLYWYHRNSSLNANYWFNNRDLAPIDNETGLTCTAVNYDPNKCKAPRARLLLNQNGFRLGGPIILPKKLFGPLGFNGRDKAFFFVNYEEYRLPNQISRPRTILSPSAQQGLFRYNTSSGVREVNLLTLSAPNVSAVGPDPIVAKLLTDIRNSTVGTGGITQLTDPNLQQFTFINSAMDNQYYPTIRLDFNLTSKHHLECESRVEVQTQQRL